MSTRDRPPSRARLWQDGRWADALAGDGRRAASRATVIGEEEPVSAQTSSGSRGVQQVLLSREEVATRPRSPLGDVPGVQHAVLWEQGRSSAGQMWFEPHARLPEHEHGGHAHHLWVLSGQVRVGGRTLNSGSYCYIPHDEPHGFDAGRDGCTIAYLYLED